MTVLRFSTFTIAVLFARAVVAHDAGLEQRTIEIQNQIESGDLPAALHDANEALTRYRGDGGFLNLRGIIYAKQGHFAEARSDFEKAVQASPRLVPAWKNLARVCEMDSKGNSGTACAEKAWLRVQSLTPKDEEAAAALSKAYERLSQYSASLDELRKLPESERSQTDNLLIQCQDLVGTSRLSEARGVADKLAGRSDFSAADVSAISVGNDKKQTARLKTVLLAALDSRQPLSVTGLKNLAINQEMLEDWAGARKTLERAAMVDATNPAHLIELARVAEVMNDHEGALGYLGHARDLAPKDAQIHYLIAMISAELDLPVQARKSLELALAIEPDNPHYNYSMGYVILSTRDAASAAKYFERYLKENPTSTTGHYALGIAYFASGDYAGAKREMKLVQNGPKAGGADYFLGRMARIEGDLDGAAVLLRQSIQLLPAFAPSHTELARVWMDEDKLSDAESELNKAIHLDARNFLANEQLLAVYRRTHDPRANGQSELLKKLDEERSKRAELMLRTIEFKQ